MTAENLTLATDRNPYNYVKIEQIDRDLQTQWLTLEEITQQLNLFADESQDNYLTSIELATRMAIEDYLGMSIFPTKYRIYYNNFGLYNTQVFLDLPEVSQGASGVTVNAVKYFAGSNTTPETIASSGYSYDATGNRIIVNSIPNDLNQIVANPIYAEYTSNANFLGNYPVIKQAGLLLLTHIYNNRSNTTEANLKSIPFGVDQLLRSYKPLVM
jgi:hypothetical protein